MIQFAPAPIRRVTGGLFASMLLHCAASCRALPYCTLTLICEIRVAPCLDVKPPSRDHSPCVCVGCFFLRPSSSWTTTSAGLVERPGNVEFQAAEYPRRVRSSRVHSWVCIGFLPLPVGLTCSAMRTVITSRSFLHSFNRDDSDDTALAREFLSAVCTEGVCECDLQRPCFFLGFLFFFSWHRSTRTKSGTAPRVQEDHVGFHWEPGCLNCDHIVASPHRVRRVVSISL